nr:hypothetical protein [Nocardioides panacis]
MPKSSSAIRTPSALRWCSTSSARSLSSMRIVSVTSSTRLRGAIPVAARTEVTSATKSGCMSCRADTFTARSNGESGWSIRQRTASVQACVSTQVPSRFIRPLCSATATIDGGEIGPRSGWFQRSSASTPQTSPSRQRTSGW